MLSQATFALGCFWTPDAQFGSLVGVERTQVGYCGGTKPTCPNYKNIGDYSECVQVYFNSKRITYDDLLDIFWRCHDPIGYAGTGQYASAIFCHDDEQFRKAQLSKLAQEVKYGRPILTRIDRLFNFTRAEEYHQKHYLQRITLFKSVELCELTAAKLNGFLAGYGTIDQFETLNNKLALNAEQEEYVRTQIMK